MASGEQGSIGLDAIRQSEAYPAVLWAGRLYVGGLVAMLVGAFVVYTLELSFSFFLLPAAAVPFVIVGAFMAKHGFRRLAREFPKVKIEELRSGGTIAAFQDMFKRRGSGPR
ncbi:hypothetical protein Rhe02_39130 [Rhizocola hellebori]|uniref:Uncharacterized protein n=1 Tax=Rhizocola hellebori TaxID=1392758 RepID=A0A8J3VHA9_9ACTN|nr:hypothetical protein Rhe02_39130 [Rhizocola hellebori]